MGAIGRKGPGTPSSADSGFGLVEVLLATVLAATILVAALATVHVHLRTLRAHPGLMDVAARGRAFAEVVFADTVLAAGGGFSLPDGQSAPACCLPAVNPRRVGLRRADAPGTSRDDVVTLVFLPKGASGLRTAAELSTAALALSLSDGPSCPALPLCGLSDRDDVVVFDGTGNHDYFRLSATSAPVLAPRQESFTGSYGVGAAIARVETHTYYFDNRARQLRHYDGYLADSPLIDNVAGFTVEYWGEDRAPVFPKPPTGVGNCLYDGTGTLLPWPGEVSNGPALVHLPLSAFTDGPWCGSGDNRFDADLLRVRRVRFRVRMEAEDGVRAGGSLFVHPGRASSALSLAPDLPLTIDVTPRGLNAGR